uniref:uncharacterized protein LOC101300729 isoform X2 n=1 Tax=Fragaria vesca subsp. vesca TaxID=101020 RepID=UPI0005C8F8E8|nr:PREDICTED: uncharacterized protein LOC101300729 isoform X2 [Fragaria vesca subsp. vesca]
MPTSSFLLSLASLHTATYVLALRRFFSLDLRRFLLSQAIDLGFVKAMLPKFRTSKRKAFFRTPENLQPELTGHETAAPSHSKGCTKQLALFIWYPGTYIFIPVSSVITLLPFSSYILNRLSRQRISRVSSFYCDAERD